MNTRIRSKGVLFAMLLGVVVATVVGLGAAPAMAGNKIEICHIPPGNPDNFHTIKISENAFSAHLAHGDLGGPCDAACATLCDDGNACTIDDSGDCEQYGCPTTPEPVDCDDQNECTADSCAPASGCVNTARLNEDCDDGQVCSGPDTCNAQGVCQGPGIDNCCLDDSACSQDPCDQASCNLGTNRCGEDPVVCNPPDLCTVSECAPDTGECVNTAIVCSDGETCNPTTGDCEVTGLVGVWCFDEGQGTNAADSSGNDNPATLQNGAGWAPGVFGTSLDLDGVDDWASVSNLSGTDPANGLTVAAWVKFPSPGGFNSPQYYVIDARSGSGYYLNVDTELIQFPGHNLFVSTPLTTGEWHHVVGTIGSTDVVYIDGVAVSTSSAGIPNYATSLLNIGRRYTGDEYFDGQIDELAIWSRGLSAAEVSDIYNSSTGLCAQ